MPPVVQLSLKDLHDNWRTLLQWGPCFCQALAGERCPSCVNAQRIEAAGLEWVTEYEKAIEAGNAILL